MKFVRGMEKTRENDKDNSLGSKEPLAEGRRGVGRSKLAAVVAVLGLAVGGTAVAGTASCGRNFVVQPQEDATITDAKTDGPMDVEVDAQRPDARVDADVLDANVPDADVLDANVPDANTHDANVPDADVLDANVPDAEVQPDAEVIPDAAVDAGPPTCVTTAYEASLMNGQFPMGGDVEVGGYLFTYLSPFDPMSATIGITCGATGTTVAPDQVFGIMDMNQPRTIHISEGNMDVTLMVQGWGPNDAFMNVDVVNH